MRAVEDWDELRGATAPASCSTSHVFTFAAEQAFALSNGGMGHSAA